MPHNIEIAKLHRVLTEHILECTAHKAEMLELAKLNQEAHSRNMEAIAALTKATEGLVEAWCAVNTMQRFLKWLSSFAILGGVAAWAITKLFPHLPTPP